jgi:hypothetical protein
MWLLSSPCSMVVFPPDFTPAVLKEEDKYEGKHLDPNIIAGAYS